MLQFQVRGSAGDLYDVKADRRDRVLFMTCTCEAAINGIHCHHRLELLRGDASSVTSNNAADVKQLVALLDGTPLQTALKQVEEAEVAQRAAKTERDRRMKLLDRALLGH